MKSTAKVINTPVGPYKAPLHPGFVDKLSKCNTNKDLFELVDDGKFVDPDALCEVMARGLYDEYKKWKQEAANE